MNIDQGQVVTFRATFRSSAGAAADPTTVTWRMKAPAGTETAYVYGTASEATRESIGVFVLRIQLSTPGSWFCRVEGTGAVAACDELPAIGVRTSQFATAV